MSVLKAYASFFATLGKSIVTADFPILLTGIAEFLIWVWLNYLIQSLEKRSRLPAAEAQKSFTLPFMLHIWTKKSIPEHMDMIRKRHFAYVTVITIFPLLGMLGTVKSLIALDITSFGSGEAAVPYFFDALTSTAWGILFSMLFKLLNIHSQTAMERAMAAAESNAAFEEKMQDRIDRLHNRRKSL